jgi:hypothetical protein
MIQLFYRWSLEIVCYVYYEPVSSFGSMLLMSLCCFFGFQQHEGVASVKWPQRSVHPSLQNELKSNIKKTARKREPNTCQVPPTSSSVDLGPEVS